MGVPGFAGANGVPVSVYNDCYTLVVVPLAKLVSRLRRLTHAAACSLDVEGQLRVIVTECSASMYAPAVVHLRRQVSTGLAESPGI